MKKVDWFIFPYIRSIFTLLTISVMMTLISCGSGGGAKYYDDNGQAGSAKLVVSHSKGAESEKAFAVAKNYKVTVSGPGIEEPIIAEFDGSAKEGVVDGIPSGSDRVVIVEAINLNGQLIREGRTDGINIVPGVVSDVEVKMDAVPIFANLSDGNVVASNRLRLEIFSDPGDAVMVEDIFGDSSVPLFDLSTNSNEVYTDVSSGIAVVVPSGLTFGDHTFKAVSKITGKESLVKIKVVDGSKIYGAPIIRGGMVGNVGDYLKVSRVGSMVNAGSGASWPRVLNAVLTDY